ncbi:LysM peptidoglycan-binding domain-containing protein [Paenibacillus physcomitrellae]|uniref:LysM domain-containing protein n=1 Tax=Paenibacillus physcomitrellae TaxID=1619311 RepID=A0ABQ1G4H2_9BACL|nr:LysM peptidoglycan-binding domain-containing protein [Paenibacillus physcomitrellae]GGA36497.1 hypothetical protein GCM10010917_22120 [Paenibacillus physcomitrellae]
MADQSYGLRFDIYERVHLSAEEVGIDELEEIELYPRIQVVSGDDYATLRGHLLLTGLYRGEGESRELSHLIPVEITVPLNRVNRLEDISVEIENFDVDLLNERSLNVTGVLSLQGIETAAFAPAAQDWSSREYTASYVQEDFNPGNDPWIQADAAFLQQEQSFEAEQIQGREQLQEQVQKVQQQAEFLSDYEAQVEQEVANVSGEAGANAEEQLGEQVTGGASNESWFAAGSQESERFGQDDTANQFAQTDHENLNPGFGVVSSIPAREEEAGLPGNSFASLATPELQRTEEQQTASDTWFSFEDGQASETQAPAFSSADEAVPREQAEVQVWNISSQQAETAVQSAFSNIADSEPVQAEETRHEEQAPAASEESEKQPAPDNQVPAEENSAIENAPGPENSQLPESEIDQLEEKPQELKIALGTKNKTIPEKEGHFGFSQLLNSSKAPTVSEETEILVPEEPSPESLQAEREERQWKQAFISNLNEETPFRKVRMVIVQREETIDEIADRYSMSARELLLHNRLSEQTIEEGQVLYLP